MQSDLQNPQLYNRDAQTLTIVSYFRKIFMLYVQWEVIIIHLKHGSITQHLQRLKEKATGWPMSSGRGWTSGSGLSTSFVGPSASCLSYTVNKHK